MQTRENQLKFWQFLPASLLFFTGRRRWPFLHDHRDCPANRPSLALFLLPGYRHCRLDDDAHLFPAQAVPLHACGGSPPHPAGGGLCWGFCCRPGLVADRPHAFTQPWLDIRDCPGAGRIPHPPLGTQHLEAALSASCLICAPYLPSTKSSNSLKFKHLALITAGIWSPIKFAKLNHSFAKLPLLPLPISNQF